MAKPKNRDKRKAAAQKKANQQRAQKAEMYEGYMQIPLDNSFSSETVRNKTEYYGDWVSLAKRRKIMGEPRMFIVTAHVYMIDGKRYYATIKYQGYGERDTIPDAANMAFNEVRNGSGLVNMSESYVVVRAQKDMSKFPKEIDVEALKAKRASEKKAPIMGLLQPYDYDYLWNEVISGA